jgi:murein DD-endopeptidase MepM/ murein hydrolase activator NlpD
VDLVSSCGSPVLASAEGAVLIVRSSGWNGGYGRYLALNHPNGTQTLYAHLLGILASPGQYVSQGAQIATVGSTGNSTGCHLHFEIRGARNPF